MIKLAIFLLTPAAWAQIETGSIVGSVSDASGAKAPAVRISIASSRTGRVTTVESNGEGCYQSPPLSPGEYRLTAEREGFKRAVSKVRVEVNERVSMDFRLELGDVSQQIEVTATAPGLETESSSLGSVRSEKAVAELPLNARNYAFLIGLALAPYRPRIALRARCQARRGAV